MNGRPGGRNAETDTGSRLRAWGFSLRQPGGAASRPARVLAGASALSPSDAGAGVRRAGVIPRVAGLLALLAALTATPAGAQLVISEFMAANSTALKDEDGDNSDWIELHNEGTLATHLGGWSLTDDTNNLSKWPFPSTNVPPNGYLVVFASEKDRRVPGAPLHTNFKLSSGGEYLALVRPGGTDVASAFAPVFPPQLPDVSYGSVRETASVLLLDTGAVARAFVPADNSLGSSWTLVEFDDAQWTNGPTGLGYDRQTVGVNFLPLIGLNVEALMYPFQATLYARLPFTVASPGALSSLTLRLKFEDGFVAYLNGQEIARSNAPATLAWNSVATTPRTDTAATNFVDFDISESRGFLVTGANVLAFQVLNNPTNSPDLLLLPQLVGLTPNGPPTLRYFPVPTPGRANNAGVFAVGPIISDPQQSPPLPSDSDDIVVTARLRPAFAPVGSAALRYRVMFGAEVTVPFLDDGAHGDGAAGDGVYGGTIPAGASTPGQMVRWYITGTDATGTNLSRFPPFTATNESPAYLGTVIANPALTNALPVFHWFVQDVTATDTAAGTWCSVYYQGEFYDHVFCRVRGASAPTFPKKPYKFDFNPGDHFRFAPGQPRVDELNLNTTYQDKAHVRAPLTFETYRTAGVPACDAFNVRVQQNNNFYSVAVFVEQVDETFLERRGLAPNGALYKLFNGINSASSGVEKKTRLGENNADLQIVINAVNPANPNRARDLFDVLDLPEIINYLAAGTIAMDWDRAVKNIYLYRDTDGTGLWQMFPWDKDLSFGKTALVNDSVTAIKDGAAGASGEPYVSHPFYGAASINCCGMNNLIDAVYAGPVTRQMYLRRLRTLMDLLLQPPGTATNQLHYEARLDRLFDELKNDAALDLSRWGTTYGVPQTLAVALGALRTNYVAPRRTHLFQTHSVDNIGSYPQAVGVPHAQAGIAPLQFGAIESNPGAGRQTEEYVELLNPNPVAVDLSGWQVAGGIEFTFRPGSVIPAGGRLYLSPNVTAFKARTTGPRGGQGLLVLGNYQGQLSARGEPLTLLDVAGGTVAATNYPGAPSPAQQFLRITELMFHPAPPPPGDTTDPESFEFIELRNIGSAALDLTGIRFSNGIEFTAGAAPALLLAPGESLVVVHSLAAFRARYGSGPRVAGEFTGSLENGGERITLLDAEGEEILDFTYDNRWYPVTDGLGFSLAIVDPALRPEQWGDKSSWRPSGTLLGSPGVSEPSPPAIPAVVVNELLSNTDPPSVDAIELQNLADLSADISGWFLTDDPSFPKKFRIPDGTVLAPGRFLVLNETNFNLPPGAPLSFSFSSDGDEAYLFSAEPAGRLTGYAHGFRFEAAENGVSFGRYRTSIGEEHFVAQSAVTLGSTNASPKIGPVVITEIMYHPAAAEVAAFTPSSGVGSGSLVPTGPAAGNFEYLELENVSAGPVPLYDPLRSTNTWRLRNAVEFDFPPGLILQPGARLLVVGFNPATDSTALAAFRAAYALGSEVIVLGPWAGQLGNAGDPLELRKPAEPTLAGVIPYVLVDGVHYRGVPPWPLAADGGGASLQRFPLLTYGDDPANWLGAGRTPGLENSPNLPGGYPQTVLADRPVHYYRFDETNGTAAADSGVPGGNNGVLTGGIALDQPSASPVLGRALRSSGAAGSYVSLGLFHPGDSVTLEAWVNLDPAANNDPSYNAIIARWDGSYELDVAPGDLVNLVVRNQVNAFGAVAAPAPLVRGQWYHVVGLYDAGVLALYLNGQQVAVTPFAGALRNGGPVPDRVLVGATRDGTSAAFPWRGLLDEVAIYNYGLSAAQILAHAQAGAPPPLGLALLPSGVLSWPSHDPQFLLQSTPALFPSQWVTDPSARTNTGALFRVVVPVNQPARFYRLFKP